MPRKTQVEIFIATLTELVGVERDRERARLHREHKAHAERFIEAFKADFDGVSHSFRRALHNERAVQDAMMQIEHE